MTWGCADYVLYTNGLETVWRYVGVTPRSDGANGGIQTNGTAGAIARAAPGLEDGDHAAQG